MSATDKIHSDEASRRASASSSPKTRIDVKVVIMGHGGVGKTSFINRYIHNDFAETISTIGASFVLKKWRTFYLGIWDTAGQERFTKISNYYCRGAQAAILAYDITDRDSFEALDNYARFLMDSDRDCLVVVIGTKLDLVQDDPEHRQVTYEEGETYARQHRASFYETSAKDNLNVTPVFDRIAYQCLAPKLAAAGSSASGSGDDTGHMSPKNIDAAHSRLVVASADAAAVDADKRLCCSVQ